VMLGRLIAADVCINNSDRMPVESIWSTQGNTHNLLFKI